MRYCSIWHREQLPITETNKLPPVEGYQILGYNNPLLAENLLGYAVDLQIISGDFIRGTFKFQILVAMLTIVLSLLKIFPYFMYLKCKTQLLKSKSHNIK